MVDAQDDRADVTSRIEVAREFAGVCIFVREGERAAASECVPGGGAT